MNYRDIRKRYLHSICRRQLYSTTSMESTFSISTISTHVCQPIPLHPPVWYVHPSNCIRPYGMSIHPIASARMVCPSIHPSIHHIHPSVCYVHPSHPPVCPLHPSVRLLHTPVWFVHSSIRPSTSIRPSITSTHLSVTPIRPSVTSARMVCLFCSET